MNKQTKKYVLLENDTIEIEGHRLYRIKALKNFRTASETGTLDGLSISKNSLGGYIESEKNLSHKGKAWVGSNGKVYQDAVVSDNAYVDYAEIFGRAKIYGEAYVNGSHYDTNSVHIFANADICDAMVTGNSYIYGNAKLSGFLWVLDSQIFDDAYIYCNKETTDFFIRKSTVFGRATICGNIYRGYIANVENACIGGNALIRHSNDYLVITANMDTARETTFFRTKSGVGVLSDQYIDKNGKVEKLPILSIEDFLQYIKLEYSKDIEFWQLITEAAKLRIQKEHG